MKKFLLLLSVIFLMGFAFNVQAYQKLMEDDQYFAYLDPSWYSPNEIDVDDDSVTDYYIANFYIGQTPAYHTTYFGHLGSNTVGGFTGYYIGTVLGENTSPNAFSDLIGYYLDDPTWEYIELKAEDTNGWSDGPLVVTSDDNWYSGSWSFSSPGFKLGFYAIKGSNSFAMYYVPPPMLDEGFWTTEHLLTGGGTNPQLSHLSVAAVPEPTTMLLLGAGLIGLAAIGRKKFSK